MLFNSYEFLFAFLPCTLLLYILFGHFSGKGIATAFLCVASLFFYGWWNVNYLPLILFSLIFNYSVGRSFTFFADSTGLKKSLLFCGVAVNLLLLGYFKYANFFIENFELATGTQLNWPNVALPIAISFFTFQQIAYLIDTSKAVTTEKNFISYVLFVTFFPQLIAGPIVHHAEMMPQFSSDSKFRFLKSDFAVGLTIFSIGLFKKVAIADTMGAFATPVFSAADAGQLVSFIDAWGGALSYTFQLYFDFSGYSDMAIGIGRLFGIKLPINFNSPYKATSIIEFWRRWHITLSRFLRDYLYIPLGGNRHGQLRRYLNLMITMLLGGLWHGAGWNFLFWGGLHGSYLIINSLWRSAPFYNRLPVTSRLYVLTSLLLTFLVVVVAWVPFRATNLKGGGEILSSMFSATEFQEARWGELFSIEPKKLGAESIVDWSVAKKALFKTDSPIYVDIFNSDHFDIRFTLLEIFNLHLGGGYCILLCLLIVWLLPNTQEILKGYEPGFESYKFQESYSLIRLNWKPSIGWAFTTSVAVSVCILLLGEGLSEFLYFQF